MKLIIFFLSILSFPCFSQDSFPSKNNLECKISSSKPIYKKGELPKIEVSIINKSDENIYLVGSLDGSSFKFRKPYCYFSIEKPTIDSLPKPEMCKTLNPLRMEDFVKVKPGESFDPYLRIDEYGFFGAYNISRIDNFRNTGKYKISFYYSTFEKKEKKSFVKNEELTVLNLLQLVPYVNLKSNTIEIEIVE